MCEIKSILGGGEDYFSKFLFWILFFHNLFFRNKKGNDLFQKKILFSWINIYFLIFSWIQWDPISKSLSQHSLLKHFSFTQKMCLYCVTVSHIKLLFRKDIFSKSFFSKTNCSEKNHLIFINFIWFHTVFIFSPDLFAKIHFLYVYVLSCLYNLRTGEKFWHRLFLSLKRKLKDLHQNGWRKLCKYVAPLITTCTANI